MANAGKSGLKVSIGAQLDLSGLQAGVKNLYDQLEKIKPVEVKTALSPAILTGQQNLSTAINSATEGMKKQEVVTTSLGRGFGNLGTNIKDAITNTIKYSLSLGLIRQAQKALNDAIQYTIELNKEMVNIQVLQAEGAQTDEEIRSLAGAYNELAKSMGATTIEVAQGSVEWLRQGKTIEETAELTKASLMLAKLGAMDTAEATTDLTSVLNSYKMSAEDAVLVVDKLIAVDNIAATSAGELAVALRYVAAVAGEVGVSLDQMISYIGTISSVTRLNAEQIGQAMKTILTRMQDIRAGKIDEEGLGINNVAIALERVGIELMESETEFKDFGGVLEELAGKWETLNEVEQANISKAVAGVRQANMFKILMTNMGQALDLQTAQTNAAGLALDRYEIYLEGVEAAQNKLKASVEGLWQDAISSGMITSVLNAGSSIVKFIDDIGGLNTILIISGTIIAGLIASKISLTQATKASAVATLEQTIASWKEVESIAAKAIASIQAEIAVTALNTAERKELLTTLASTQANLANAKSMQTQATASLTTAKGMGSLFKNVASLPLPLLALIAILGSLLGVMYYVSHEAERNAEAFKKATEEVKKATDEYTKLTNTKSDIQKLWTEFQTLSEKIRLTTEESKRLVDVQNELNVLSGYNLSGKYDDDLNFIIDKNVGIGETIALLNEELAIQKEIALQAAIDAAIAGETVAEDNAKKKKDLAEGALSVTQRQDVNMQFSPAKKQELEQKYRELNIKNNKKELRDIELQERAHTNEVVRIYSMLKTNEDKIAYRAQLKRKESIDAIADYEAEQITKTGEMQVTYVEKSHGKIIDLNKGVVESNQAVILTEEELANVLDTLTQSVNAVTDAGKEQTKNGYISEETAWNLVTANGELAKYLTKTAEGYIFETEAARVAMVQEARDILVKYGLYQAAIEAGKGNYFLALSAVQVSTALGKEKQSVIDLLTALQSMSQMAIPSVGGGGGSGGISAATQAEIDANEAQIEGINNQIDGLENQKKALQNRLKEFKKYIDAQKESLKLEKEERDFNKDLAKKNKDLAKLKADILILGLDDSQEAIAQRLEMEEQAAELEAEINQDLEDRKYDIQVEALDRQEALFEDMINKQLEGIDKMIDGFKLLIEEIQKVIEALREMASAGRGGLGGIPPPTTSAFVPSPKTTTGDWKPNFKPIRPPTMHEGGFAESHHDGDFAGNLKTNEVFAKLLKGEFVATEADMNNFMTNILPRIASAPSISTANNNVGGDTVNANVSVTVNGNLDNVTLKDVEGTVFTSMNKALRQRGKKTNAYNFSV